MKRHLVVIECPDDRDDARMQRAVTKAIESATHLYDPVAGTDVRVVDFLAGGQQFVLNEGRSS